MQKMFFCIIFVLTLFLFPICNAASDCSAYPTLTEPTHPANRPIETCNGVNTGSRLGNYERNLILNAHNYYRSQLAHGCSAMSNGANAPPGRNIKKMVYNCSLEAGAKAWASKCIETHSPSEERNGAGETICNIGYSSTSEDKTTTVTFRCMDWAWGELKQYGNFSSTNVTFEGEKHIIVGHWSNMAWGVSSSVGCAVNYCTDKYKLVCQYWSAGNYQGQPVYDIGTHCQADKDCTIPLWRKCETQTGLCIPSNTTLEPNYLCKNEKTNVPFNESMRTQVTNTINRYRSDLANGRVLKVDGTYAPKAKNLPKIEYDCALEKIAQIRSLECPPYAQPSNETVFLFRARDVGELKPEYYIPLALETWWKEISTAAESVNITSASTKLMAYYLINWGQMASQNAVKVGCGYTLCTDQYQQSLHSVICKYEKGIAYFDDIYSVGNACIRDSDCSLAGYNYCDTTLGLCTKTSGSSTNTPPTITPSTSTTKKITTTTTTPKTTTTIKTVTTTTKPATTTASSVPLTGCPNYGGITGMNDTWRAVVLEQFNYQRSQMAKGLLSMANNTISPKGKNIRKLVYNCSLELEAKKLLDKCEAYNTGKNGVFNFFYILDTEDSIKPEYFRYNAEFIFKYSSGNVTTISNVPYLKIKLYGFGYDAATSIGCYYEKKSCYGQYSTSIYCAINPIGNYLNDDIAYEVGAPCTQNAHCTKSGYNKCDTALGLCYK